MKVYLNETQKIIIQLLNESPKSFTELKQAGGEDLKSDATLSRNLNRLVDENLIEKFDPPEKIPHIRFRYRLTQIYHDQKEVDQKKQRLKDWISSKLESQSIFNFLKHFFENEYLNLALSPKFQEILLDVYSYIKFFGLTLNKLVKNPRIYINTIIFLIFQHPDQKYKAYREEMPLSSLKLQELINEFRSNQSIEEFRFKTGSKEDLSFFLISGDPILHNFKEQIETVFQKFLICWEFPSIKFEENFDFLLRYSHQILDDEYNNISPEKEQLIQFFTENKLCLLTFIREYLWEFLEKLKLDSDLEPPFKLLHFQEKEKIRSKVLLSSQILPSSEKKRIEDYFYNPAVDKEKRLALVQNLLMELARKIEEISDTKGSNEVERLIYLENHLLFLLKIFQKVDKPMYQQFRKKTEILTQLKSVKLSYSHISDEIFKKVVDLKLGYGENFDYEKRSFTIRFLIERIDHLLNQFAIGGMKKPKVEEKIQKIYDIASNFSMRTQYPFIKKKLEIENQNLNLITDYEKEEAKNFLKKFSRSDAIQEEVFPFEGVFQKKSYIYEDPNFEGWESSFHKNQAEILKYMNNMDIFLYHNDNLNNLEELDEFMLLLFENYGIEWTLRYLNVYLNYLEWFIVRRDYLDFTDIKNPITREDLTDILKFIGNYIRGLIFWKYREGSEAEGYFQKADKLLNKLTHNRPLLLDFDLLNSYKEKFERLKLEMRQIR